MLDQATRLREIATNIGRDEKNLNFAERSVTPKARIIAVTSGKGGVGKTNIAVNLALKLIEFHNKVLLIDTDLNLANADIIMGISPQYTMADALIKDYDVNDVVLSGPGGIHFLPGGSGLVELIQMPDAKRNRLFRQLEMLEHKYDYVILDTPAGLNKQVLDYLMFATQVIVVATPEPTSIADAYAMVKVLAMQRQKPPVHIIVNQTESSEHSKEVFARFKMVVDKFLDIKVRYMGYIEADKNVMRAVIKQRPFVMEYPKSRATRCIENIAEKVITGGNAKIGRNSGSFFAKLAKFSIFH